MTLPLVISPGDSGHIGHHEEIDELLSLLDGQTDFLGTGVAKGTLASRPVPGIANDRLMYLATDVPSFSISDGTIWNDQVLASMANTFTAPQVFEDDVFFGSGHPWIDALDPKYNNDNGGVVDTSAGLITAIADSVAADAELWIPPGVYFTGTTTLVTPTTANKSIRIRGSGKGITRITRQAGSATHSLWIKLTGTVPLISLSDFTLNGPTGLTHDNASVGIQGVGPTTATLTQITDVKVDGTHESAIQLSYKGRRELFRCDLESTDAICGQFESTDTFDSAWVHIEGGTWNTNVIGGDLSSGGSAGLYIHPHISYRVIGVRFEGMGRYGIYQNGSPGSHRKYAVAVGCIFTANAFAQTKTTGPSDFVGCTVNGQTSSLSSSLGGTVNIIGGTFTGHSLNYGPVSSSIVTITGASFYNSVVHTCGNTGSAYRWQIKSSSFAVDDTNTFTSNPLNCVGGGTTDVIDCDFNDDSTTLSYQAFIGIDSSQPNVRVVGCVARNGRGTNGGFIHMSQGTLYVWDCEIDPGAGGNVQGIRIDTGVAAGAVTGGNLRLLNGAIISGSSSVQQRLQRRQQINPNSIAVGVTIDMGQSVMQAYDTHEMTGVGVVNTLSPTFRFIGVVRFIMAAGSAIQFGNAGNIQAAAGIRTPGTIVQLLWDGIYNKWMEI